MAFFFQVVEAEPACITFRAVAFPNPESVHQSVEYSLASSLLCVLSRRCSSVAASAAGAPVDTCAGVGDFAGVGSNARTAECAGATGQGVGYRLTFASSLVTLASGSFRSPKTRRLSGARVSRRTAPAGNGRASADVLALTFPYYATAPPFSPRLTAGRRHPPPDRAERTHIIIDYLRLTAPESFCD